MALSRTRFGPRWYMSQTGTSGPRSRIQNKSLRALVAALLGVDYSAAQMTYDLRRLRLHGLIERLPHTNTYVLTPDGLRLVLFYTKLNQRLLRPLLAADHPPASPQIRDALRTIDRAIADYVANARLGVAA